MNDTNENTPECNDATESNCDSNTDEVAVSDDASNDAGDCATGDADDSAGDCSTGECTSDDSSDSSNE